MLKILKKSALSLYVYITLTLIRPENSHWNWNRIVIKIELVTPCSHFPDTCHFETIFVTHSLRVHTIPVLSAA